MGDDVPALDVTVDRANIREGLLQVLAHIRPDWKQEDIKTEPLQQGMVNLMIRCKANENKDDWLVARIFGAEINVLMSERKREVACSKLLSEVKIGPPVYCTFKNGIIYGFIKGKTFFWNDLSAFKNVKLLNSAVRVLAKLHSKATMKIALDKYSEDIQGKTLEQIIERMSQAEWPEVIIDEETTKWFLSKVPSKEDRRRELQLMMDGLLNLGAEKRFCHNDANPTNIVYDEEKDEVTMVDFEMAGMSTPFGDFSNILMFSAVGLLPEVPGAGLNLKSEVPEMAFHSLEMQREVTRTYLTELKRLDGEESDVTDEEVERLREISEAFFAIHGFFFHVIAIQIVRSPDLPMDPKVFLKLSIDRLDWWWKSRENVLAILDKYATTTTAERNGEPTES